MDKLQGHVRQFRHNNSDEFVAGYEIDGVDIEFELQQKEIEALKEQLDLIKQKWAGAGSDIQILFNQQPQNMSDGSYLVDGQACHELNRAIMGELNQQGDSNGK